MKYKVTEAEVAESMMGDVLMICTACDCRDVGCYEQDAEGCECPDCGEHKFTSVQELLFMDMLDIVDDGTGPDTLDMQGILDWGLS